MLKPWRCSELHAQLDAQAQQLAQQQAQLQRQALRLDALEGEQDQQLLTAQWFAHRLSQAGESLTALWTLVTGFSYKLKVNTYH